MAKQDVLDAINATIVPNGAKAINADSLRNVLTMMTENAGEGGGSGDGALRIMMPDYASARDVFIPEGAFNSEIIELFRTEAEGSGADLEPMFAAWETALSHNAEVYQQLLAKTKANEGTMVIMDSSLSYSIGMKIAYEQIVPGMIEEIYISMGQLGIFNGMYGKMSGEEAENMGIIPLSIPEIDAGDSLYPSSITMLLQPDGSIVFEVFEEEQPSSGSGVVTFYFDPTIGGFTEEKKAKNAESYASFFDMGGECSVILKNFILPETILTSPCVTMGIAEDGLLALMVLDTDVTNPTGGFSKITYMVSSDGSITVQQ